MPDNTEIERFLDSLQQQKSFSTNTLSAYRNDLSQFSDFLGAGQGSYVKPVRDWSAVTRDSIMQFLLFLKERSYAPTTVARKQAAIKSFFRYLASKGLVAHNPAEDLASPHVDRALPQTMSTSEVDRLLIELNAPDSSPESLRDRAMLQLLFATGLRVGEMVGLNLGNVDLEAGAINITGRGKSRLVSIATQAGAEALREYLAKGRPILLGHADRGATLAEGSEGEKKSGEALFLNHRGQRLTRQGFWLILKRYAKSAGLGEVTPHTLRHSFAAQTLHEGADMRDLQRMLGHASISTTQVYARIGQRGDRKKETLSANRSQRKAVS